MSTCAVTSDAAGKTRGSFRTRLPRRTTQCLLAEGRRKCPSASSLANNAWEADGSVRLSRHRRTPPGRLGEGSTRAIIFGCCGGDQWKRPTMWSSSNDVGDLGGRFYRFPLPWQEAVCLEAVHLAPGGVYLEGHLCLCHPRFILKFQ